MSWELLSSLHAGRGALGGLKLTAGRESTGMLLPAPACFPAKTSLPQPEHGLRSHHRLA